MNISDFRGLFFFFFFLNRAEVKVVQQNGLVGDIRRNCLLTREAIRSVSIFEEHLFRGSVGLSAYGSNV